MPIPESVKLPWLLLDTSATPKLQCTQCRATYNLGSTVVLDNGLLTLTGLSEAMVQFATRHLHLSVPVHAPRQPTVAA